MEPTTTTELAALEAEVAALGAPSAEQDARIDAILARCQVALDAINRQLTEVTTALDAIDAIEREPDASQGPTRAPLTPPTPPTPMEHPTPDLIALESQRTRAGAPVRCRMGSPAALAAALAALKPDPNALYALIAARSSQWQEQLTALEDARQALLHDRPNWLVGAPTVMISVIRDSATKCHE